MLEQDYNILKNCFVTIIRGAEDDNTCFRLQGTEPKTNTNRQQLCGNLATLSTRSQKKNSSFLQEYGD